MEASVYVYCDASSGGFPFDPFRLHFKEREVQCCLCKNGDYQTGAHKLCMVEQLTCLVVHIFCLGNNTGRKCFFLKEIIMNMPSRHNHPSHSFINPVNESEQKPMKTSLRAFLKIRD